MHAGLKALLHQLHFVLGKSKGFHTSTEDLADRKNDLVIFGHRRFGARRGRREGYGRKGAEQQDRNPDHERSPGGIRRLF